MGLPSTNADGVRWVVSRECVSFQKGRQETFAYTFVCFIAHFGNPQIYSQTASRPPVEFFEFNEEYLVLLRASDPPTCAHFFAYFDRLLRMLLRARGLPPDRVDDLIQETFLRVLSKVQREGAIREPDHFGSYVNSICKNAARETERTGKRADPIEDSHSDIPDKVPSAQAELEKREMKEKVRKVLLGMPPKDRDLLRELFFLEKDKDEICRERGVHREYLRVLVHRAKTRFRTDFEGK